MQNYVVIGSGVAGLAAIEAIRSRDTRGEVIQISDEKSGYYSRPGLAYILTQEISEQQLFPINNQQFNRLNVRQIQNRVIEIDPDLQQVKLADGKKIAYTHLLVTTGARAALPELPGNHLEGVVTLDSLDDARKIIRLSRKSRSAVVVGGGITALEIVEGLRARRVKTHYLLRRDRYWSNVLDETESRIVENRLKDEGVTIHYHSEVKEVVGKRGKVTGVITNDDRMIPCHIVAFAIGIRPRIELAQAAGLETDRGILVNEYLQTKFSNIYAAGDVAQAFDPVSGKAIIDSLWGPARKQGYCAGLNMTGLKQAYQRDPSFNVTRLAGLTTTIIGTVGRGEDADLIGIMRGDSESWRNAPDAIICQSNFEVNRLRILVGKEHIIGAIVMGDQTLSNILQQLIVEKIDITLYRNQLLQPGAPIEELITQIWKIQRCQNELQCA